MPPIRAPFLALALAGAIAAFPAYALDLHTARSHGLVGEAADGYAVALQPSPEVNELVTDVNSRRQQEYERIASQKGQPVSVVAKLAAQQVISRLESGAPYQAADGSWKKR